MVDMKEELFMNILKSPMIDIAIEKIRKDMSSMAILLTN